MKGIIYPDQILFNAATVPRVSVTTKLETVTTKGKIYSEKCSIKIENVLSNELFIIQTEVFCSIKNLFVDKRYNNTCGDLIIPG